jgi:hypothetical protein
MTAKERTQAARDALGAILFWHGHGNAQVEVAAGRRLYGAIDALASACVAEARANIVEWIRGTDARLDAQAKAGVPEFHYMHTIGMREAARGLADAIERGEDQEAAK